MFEMEDQELRPPVAQVPPRETPQNLASTKDTEIRPFTVPDVALSTPKAIEDENLLPRAVEATSLQRSRSPRPSVSRPSFPRAVSIPQPSKSRPEAPDNHRVFNRHGNRGAVDDVPRRESVMANAQEIPSPPPSPTPRSLPLPPFSIPSYLQMEMSSERPSPLFIHRSPGYETAYEPSHVKFERLLNFLLLPPQLERVLLFGALTCLDAWLYTFTILPLRFGKALILVLQMLASEASREARFLWEFVYQGSGRVWERRTSSTPAPSRRSSFIESTPTAAMQRKLNRDAAFSKLDSRQNSYTKHSQFGANHKADLIQGLLIITSCAILMRFDASKMYHGIRGQAAIKLYVIYNVLEVCDRLFSALGQDIIECLFSPETLDRKPNGRTNLITPFWMFLLALIYTVIHSTAFFYQVITLNVAVNSYSNALLTLLMSNQFVEIKGTVFKKFEKENLFQLTCADVVERFQLWIMLLIIALRNIVELGGVSAVSHDASSPTNTAPANATSFVPRAFSILPNAFTVLPSPANLRPLTPFLLVLGSEMLVDWLKHAYITKFNATAPRVYSRYYDVLAKDYYTHAFGSQNLVRRLGLPVIPLACLFIRAVLQTYHMFLSTNLTVPSIVTASASSLASDEALATASPAIAQIDHIFRTALRRSAFGGGSTMSPSHSRLSAWGLGWLVGWTLDDVIALTTMIVFFAALYLLLLVLKLALGMALLGIARERYGKISHRRLDQDAVQTSVERSSKRIGGWGTIEVGDARRKLIYEGDDAGLKHAREREAKSHIAQASQKDSGYEKLDTVDRYSMVAKRIW